jgi:polysaccharide deacetylase 2 family uncharacterized protein YibQ
LVIIETIVIIFLWRSRPKKIIKIPAIPKAKVALVIDDWGYNLHNLHILRQIKYPLTASVLPHLSYTRSVTEELHRLGLEIILHLPMEPHEKYRLERNTILTSMDEKTITDIIDSDLVNVPYARGVSNHMGSKATEDLRTMSIIFNKLNDRGLYFLDSVVTPKSICPELAKRMRLAFAKRDVFLDNKQDPQYIRRQINTLKMKANVYGKAIGICHDQKLTLETLREVMPELENEGYKFVFLSELVR